VAEGETDSDFDAETEIEGIAVPDWVVERLNGLPKVCWGDTDAVKLIARDVTEGLTVRENEGLPIVPTKL